MVAQERAFKKINGQAPPNPGTWSRSKHVHAAFGRALFTPASSFFSFIFKDKVKNEYHFSTCKGVTEGRRHLVLVYGARGANTMEHSGLPLGCL